MNEIFLYNCKTSIGEFVIGIINDKCCLMDFKYRKLFPKIKSRVERLFNAELLWETKPLHLEIEQQLNDYLHGDRDEFTIPLDIRGTKFQEQVWNELLNIPYGQTISYIELATRIDNPKAVRAVGAANGNNGIAIIIPCHRVIAKDGSLHGYGGGLPVKKKLLSLEKQNSLENWF